MKRNFILVLMIFSSCCSSGQISIDNHEKTFSFPISFLRYTDFHIHPTYKHYFRDKTSKQMREILDNAFYDKEKDSVFVTSNFKNKLRRLNWEKFPKALNGPNRRSLQWGETSDLRNYDQAGYPELKYVPGSILCNSYSPYEKQFALQFPQRLISSVLVTRMGLRRLNAYSKDNHTPLNDFLAEYYYNTMQDNEDTAKLLIPVNFYNGIGNKYRSGFTYINRIQMIKSKQELEAAITHNNALFDDFNNLENLYKPGIPKLIITPLIMTIEGAQVLYDSISAKKHNIVRPFISSIQDNKASLNDTILGKQIHEELLRSVCKLRNLQHRLFFITPAHFAQNHVVGYAKTLDRNPSGIEHRALNFLSETSFINSIIKKDYEGFNIGCAANDTKSKPDSIGFKIIETFLNPDSSKFKKPTYIDVKHMDIAARLQYYALRRKYEVQFGINIPIIASHFGVSGECQALAKATGALFYPNGERVKTKYFDSHKEIDHTLSYYKERKSYLSKYDSIINKQKKLIITDSMRAGQIREQFEFNKKTYMGFNETIDESDAAGDFTSEDIFIDPGKVGWYYPWSINLFDEEIIEINRSGGIIGLLLDPRQLGAYMKNYKHIRRDSLPAYLKYKNKISAKDIAPLGLTLADIDSTEYFKTEPLIRNWFYIINVLKLQKAAEKFYLASGKNMELTKKKYHCFVKPGKNDRTKGVWETVAIGGDFDGLIDPIDYAPTVSYIPQLRAKMVVYAWMFAQIHIAEFYEPDNGKPLLEKLDDSMKRLEQFFYSNGQKFIAEYF